MAKQNNPLTELQALEGIYEHLSTIDDLTKEVGAISVRLRKIEEQLKEPVDIVDPILNPGHSREYSRDTCIYGALIKSIEACMALAEQKNVLTDITSEVRQVKSSLESIKKEQIKQNKASDELQSTLKDSTESILANFKPIMAMFVLIIIVIAVLAVTLRLCLR